MRGGAGICGCGELFHPAGLLSFGGGFSLLSRYRLQMWYTVGVLLDTFFELFKCGDTYPHVK